jgi:hypothetical protein
MAVVNPRLPHVPTADPLGRRAQELSRSAGSPPLRRTPPFPGRALTASSTAACLGGSGPEGGQKLAGLRVVMSNAVGETCRMFLCARCRSQVFVCTRCDRGNVYCPGTCALEARRARQREARRRYQATARGRAMHAARNRRYRARSRCVTHQGPSNNHKAGTLVASDIHVALSKPPVGAKWLSQPICHHCRRSASPFVRRSPLRPRRDSRRKGSQRSGLL